MAAAKTVWFSFHLGCHRSAVSLPALNVSPLTQLPQCGDWIPASVPPPAEGRFSPTNTAVFPPSSFILPSFAWVYIFFSAHQVLQSAISWCSACTSMSEGVFLMYPWREMYSTSAYSSAILFSYEFLKQFPKPGNKKIELCVKFLFCQFCTIYQFPFIYLNVWLTRICGKYVNKLRYVGKV